ncbi:hypothetical protein EHS25_007088 [Saitozyma podzolica]|uniref:D-xylose 1-dehydrogenase (NADP(+), D-xylono-1,5-lactone-forming) n=1 Tax=Saitozyma podzolica TaxID=1890683 RepID=A0A427XPJ4_9TREE|nr:hypothetical protein EHS25_007088 [Saitozyma podzolica]
MTRSILRWGIISTGGIATEFSQDLCVDPSTRGVTDISHAIAAVGSRSVASAQKFIDGLRSGPETEGWSWGAKNGVLDGCTPHGNYQDVYNDPNVDVIYIGTPPNFHHQNAKEALLAGKHVLCEKPFTFDLEELDELIALAKSKNLFLMEAVWTRFHPLAGAVREVLASGTLGKPLRFTADFSMDWNLDNEPAEHRMLNPALGGGSLLDMGPYPSVWAMLLVHQNPHNTDRDPKVINTYQTVYQRTGVDLNSRWLVEWKGLCQGQLLSDLSCPGHRDATAILQCAEGDLVVEYPPYKAETFHVVPRPDRFPGAITKKTTYHLPVAKGNNGLSYEADEVARCIRAGKIECEKMTWEESRIVQGWFDVVRRSGNTALKGLKGTAGK